MVITVGKEPDPAKRFRQHWGRQIALFRKMRGLTQGELVAGINRIGEPFGIHATANAVSKWEIGDSAPRPEFQVAIAQVLETKHSQIFNLDGETL